MMDTSGRTPGSETSLQQPSSILGLRGNFPDLPQVQALSGWIRVQAVIFQASLPSNCMQPHQTARCTGCDPRGRMGSSRVPSLKPWSSYGVW